MNLPVRTVIIYDQTYQGQPEDARLRGARLVNAMGRAGRAGKETEGWIVLVRAAAPTEADFDDLNPDAEALAVTSSLATEAALHTFAALEQAMREDEDALFRSAGTAVSDFISFVWLMLAIEEDGGTEPAAADLAAIVDATLAAQNPQARIACLTIASRVRTAYLQTGTEARRRWPRTATSIGSARAIDQLAARLAAAIISLHEQGNLGDIQDPVSAITRIRPAVAQLQALPEAPAWQFRVSPKGAATEVSAVSVLTGWLTGTSLPGLAEAHLAAAADPAWRIEQMVDAVTEHFEHYLAWTVGALAELVNARLADAGIEERLCPDLGSYIRYGVSDPQALILMTSGIRSRRLAHAIAADLPADLESAREQLSLHIARMGVAGWRARYDASAAEVLDLLDFTRVRNRSLLRTWVSPRSVETSPIREGAMAETRRKFDQDFREGAVRLVRETGKPIAQVARELGVNQGTLGNWVDDDRRRREAGGGELSEDERAELVRLRKEYAELAMRCDVLKRSLVLWVTDSDGSR